MALMTTSGSMPFSLARASIVCCRGFDIFTGLSFPTSSRSLRCRDRLKFHFQIRASNHLDRHPVSPAVVGVDQQRAVIDTAERSLEEPLAVHLLAHHDLR